MMKSSLIRINLIFILLVLFIPNLTSAESKTFIKEYTYQASEIDSNVSCRVISLELVKRLLLEELGTYLESQTEVKNFQLTKDHITVLTAGIVRAEILDESWNGNTLKYRLKAKITVDPDSIIKSIDRIRNDQKKTKELENVRKKADQAMAEIERLNKDLSATRADLDKMKQYNKAVNKLSATDWFNMAEEEANKYEPNKELIISYYEKAISLDPEYAEAYFRLGSIYLLDKAIYLEEGHDRQKYLDKSIAAYEKAIENSKDKKQERYYYSLLAMAYSDRGYIDKAISVREKVVRELLKGREVDLTQLSDKELLDRLNSQQAGYVIGPIDDAELSSEYKHLGYEYNKKGDYRQAISVFNKAVRLSPDEDNYSALAFAYKSSGNYVEAINAFKKALELSPKSRHYSSLGTMYKLNRNYDQAIKEFKNAIKVDPDDYQSYAELGSCYELKGNKKQAKAAYQKAYELKVASKKKEENFNKLSVDDLCNPVIREFGKEKYNSTLVSRYLNRAIELQPDYALPHYWEGLNKLVDYTHGRGPSMELKRAIELGYNNADVYYWLGEAYYLEFLVLKISSKKVGFNEKNQYVSFNHLFREAVRALNKAIELKPDHKNSYLVLGDIYRINSQFDFAQDSYKKASSIRKSTSLESDKYMGRYYNFRREHIRREHNGKIYDFLTRRCDDEISTFKADGFSDDKIKKVIAAGDLYPCSWLKYMVKEVTRE